MRLSLKPSVVVSPCDDGALAYDIESGQLHRLNPLAALIVELTSAQRSQEDILAEVAPLLGASAAVGCEAWIAQAIAEGLLKSIPAIHSSGIGWVNLRISLAAVSRPVRHMRSISGRVLRT